MSNLWLAETEKMIESIRRDRDMMARVYEKARKELDTKNLELAHWEAVKESYNKRHHIEIPEPSEVFHNPDTIKSLSHRELLMLIRDQNDGFIPMQQATQLFKEKVSVPAHAASAAYSAVGRMYKQGKVIKVRPGVYKWLNGTTEHKPEPLQDESFNDDRPDSDFTPDKIGIAIDWDKIRQN